MGNKEAGTEEKDYKIFPPKFRELLAVERLTEVLNNKDISENTNEFIDDVINQFETLLREPDREYLKSTVSMPEILRLLVIIGRSQNNNFANAGYGNGNGKKKT